MVRVLLTAALLAVYSANAGDLIDSWNSALLEAIRAEDTPPCLAARNLAIVHGAIYDATLAVSGGGEPFCFRVSRRKNVSLEAVINSTAFAAAKAVHPGHAADFERLYHTVRASFPDSPEISASDVLGRDAARAWIDWRSSDGSSTSIPYIPKTEPGAWRRTPPFNRPPDLPAWCLVQPFTLVGSAQFRPPGPPALGSSKYMEELQAVHELGGVQSSKRTPEQTEIARFWSDFSYSVTPPGHWNQIAQELTPGDRFSLTAKARIFAILNITLADAGIACWEAKYHFNFWRPVTAIRVAQKEGRLAAENGPAWMPLLVTPAFPEYVSGHSAFSGAAAAVLASLLGSDSAEFSVPSDTLPGKRRSFHSLQACAEEISQSRLYGGIHYPSSLRDGLAMGRQIANHVLAITGSSVPSTELKIVPLELEPGYWLGGAFLSDKRATIERLVDGGWTAWTNITPAGAVVRWKSADAPRLNSFRLVLK